MAKSKKIFPISDTQAAIGAGAIMSFFVVWVLIAGVGDDFVCWIGGKSNLSGWIQAIGSIGAIIAVWWQVNHQKMAAIKASEGDRLGRQISTLERALSLVDSIRRINGKHSIVMAAISTGSTFDEGNKLISDVFQIYAERLSGLPFWDLPDTPTAIAMQDIFEAISLLRLTIGQHASESYKMLENLDKSCYEAQVICSSRMKTLREMGMQHQ